MTENISFESTNNFEISRPAELSNWISHCIEGRDKQCGEITYIFCSDAYLLEVNKKHLNHDYYTDIITFDYTEGNLVSGDLFISTERVSDNAKELNQPFDDELHRVMIHGILHLLGLKDKTEEEAEEMRKNENLELEKRMWKL